MTRFAKAGRALAVSIVALSCATPTWAADLTIQPTHVFALWQNVNDCLVTTIRATSTKMKLIGEISDMQPAVFEAKTPTDVFARTAVVREKMERLRGKLGQEPWHEHVDVAPADAQQMHAYLAAGMVLDGIASLMVAKTGPEQAVGVCYKAAPADGMSADDVYTMVDLADRRLDAVLKAYGA